MGKGRYLWVEGVDFDSTLYDTSDLSTVRGAGLTLYALGDELVTALAVAFGDGASMVFSGASKAAFSLPEGITEPAVAEAIGKFASASTWAEMSLAWGIGEDEDANKALAIAQARALASQQRQLSVPKVSEKKAKRSCQFDLLRGATQQIKVGKDSYWVSPSVKARRDHGRERRQSFYVTEGGLTRDEVLALFATAEAEENASQNFTDSFGQIVSNSPKWVPDSVKGKMAVVYLDGNGFTGLIGKMVERGKSAAEAYSGFSTLLRDLLRERLLTPLLEAFKDDARRPLPFEILLWGGDEVMFVVPAWKALDVAKILTTSLNDEAWEIGGERLTFSIGMVIAHHKTPIRLLKQAAEDLANNLKAVSREQTQITIEVLESLEIPAEGVVEARRRSLGLDAAWPDDEASKKMGDPIGAFFALDGTAFPAAYDKLQGLRELPASQIHRWLYLARDEQRLGLNRDPAKLNAAINDYSDRIHKGGIDLALGLGANRPLAWDLVLLKTLLDYLPPTDPEAASIGQGESA